MPRSPHNVEASTDAKTLPFRQILLAGVAAGGLLLGLGLSFVEAQDMSGDDGLDAIFAAEDTDACGDENDEAGLLNVDDNADDGACGNAGADTEAADAESTDAEDDMADAEDTVEGDMLEDEDSDFADGGVTGDEGNEADEIASLFEDEDSASDSMAEIGDDAGDSEAASDVAAADTGAGAGDDAGSGSGGDGDMSLAAGGDGMGAGPGDDAGAEGGAAGGGSGDPADGGTDTAAAGSDSAGIDGGSGGASGSLIALGVGKGLTEAQNDPTSLDSLADVVVGTDQENGNKDNVAQVTALGGVTNGGSLNIGVLEVINGDTEDPLGQLLLVDADNPPAPGEVPSVDGIAEINVGDDPDGQSFNLVQIDAFDDNFLPDGSSSLANIAVGDGLDEGFGSLLGVTIADTSNNGEHDNLVDVALGSAFDPLAEPLAPVTGGLNDLGVALGEGLAPILGPLGDAIP
ncbi:MAG: hypothetical protein ACPG1C_04715 [Alphaproteobacteria bacterium]